MTQQINLKSQIKPVRDGSQYLIPALITCAVSLLALIGYRFYELSDRQTRLQAAEQEERQLQRAIAAAGRTDAQAEITQLSSKLESLQAQMETGKALAEAIERGSLALGTGHTRRLRTLADASLPGVWLQTISLDESGTGISLQGNAENPELAVSYVARVNGALSAAGARLSTLDITAKSGVDATDQPVQFRAN